MIGRDMDDSEFKDLLFAILLNGDWRARVKLYYYFSLDERLHRPPSLKKKNQIRLCFQCASDAASEGKPFAIAYFGYLHNAGIGTKEDTKKAVRLYKRAAEHNNSWGQDYLATCYYYGDGVEKNNNEASRLYQLAVNQQYPVAYYNWAILLEKTRDKKQAKMWLKLAKDEGYPPALKRACLDKGDVNPFYLYIPENKDILCTLREVSGGINLSGVNLNGVVNLSGVNSIRAYNVDIQYVGAANIRPFYFSHEIDSNWNNFYYNKEAISLADQEANYSFGKLLCLTVCLPIAILCLCDARSTCWRDKETFVPPTYTRDDNDRDKKLAQIAWAFREVALEEELAKAIERADDLLTEYLTQAKKDSPRKAAKRTKKNDRNQLYQQASQSISLFTSGPNPNASLAYNTSPEYGEPPPYSLQQNNFFAPQPSAPGEEGFVTAHGAVTMGRKM